MEDKDKLVDMLKSFISDVDKLNKRMLVCATIIISVLSISFSIMLGFIAYTYFTADYYYPNIETIDSENVTNTMGDE